MKNIRIDVSDTKALMDTMEECLHRSGMVNSNTVNSKFHLIQSFYEYLARMLSFHVYNAWMTQLLTLGLLFQFHGQLALKSH